MWPLPAQEDKVMEESDDEIEEVVEESDEVVRKRQALELKEKGNAAYKAKRLDEALQLYDEAYQKWDGDISFLTNRCCCACSDLTDGCSCILWPLCHTDPAGQGACRV